MWYFTGTAQLSYKPLPNPEPTSALAIASAHSARHYCYHTSKETITLVSITISSISQSVEKPVQQISQSVKKGMIVQAPLSQMMASRSRSVNNPRLKNCSLHIAVSQVRSLHPTNPCPCPNDSLEISQSVKSSAQQPLSELS